MPGLFSSDAESTTRVTTRTSSAVGGVVFEAPRLKNRTSARSRRRADGSTAGGITYESQFPNLQSVNVGLTFGEAESFAKTVIDASERSAKTLLDKVGSAVGAPSDAKEKTKQIVGAVAIGAVVLWLARKWL